MERADLLKSIEGLPRRKEKEWSFLETIGVDEREVTIANLLGYYFDPIEKHGLGDLFIKALLQTDCCELNENKRDKLSDEIKQYADKDFKTAKVKLEDTTDNNERIDLTIKTEQLLIAIEFKINHDLNNPLDSYVKEIEKHAGNRKTYYIVLTPMWKKPWKKAAKNKDFKQVILSKFINQVEELKSRNNIYNCADPMQMHLYQDFINMIKNRARMNILLKDYFEYFSSESGTNTDIEEIYKELNKIDNKELMKNDSLNITYKDLNDVKSTIKSKVENLRGDLKGFKIIKWDELNCAIGKQINDNTLIKIRLSLKGWQFEKWVENKKDENPKYLGKGYDEFENIKNEINKMLLEISEI